MASQPKYASMMKRVRAFIDSSYRKQLKKRKEMKALLEKLKKREKALEASLPTLASEEARAQRTNEIRMIRAQRKKALRIVKNLK